jgi:hypothetical protein
MSFCDYVLTISHTILYAIVAVAVLAAYGVRI